MIGDNVYSTIVILTDRELLCIRWMFIVCQSSNDL